MPVLQTYKFLLIVLLNYKESFELRAGQAGVPFEGLSSLYTPGGHGGLSHKVRHSFYNLEDS